MKILFLLVLITLPVGATSMLPINEDKYTMLPQDPEPEKKTEENNEAPLVLSPEERIDEIIEIENEPLILRPEEDN